MIRIYLDWNVCSYLYNFKETKEPYLSLNRTLTTQKSNILIPYSSAHLSDLIVSYKKSEKGKLKTIENLSYLAELTEHHCILHNAKEGNTYPDKYDINDYFQQLLDNEEAASAKSIDDLFKGIGGDSLSSSILDLFKLLPSGMEFINPDNSSFKSPVLSDAFNDIRQSSSYYDLLNASINLTNKYNSEPTFYRSIRNTSLEELQISNDYSQTKNPIPEIDKALESTGFQKSFVEFAETILKSYYRDKEPSKFEIFNNYYICLDFLGYYRDKVFKNMIQDSFHAFYGAHCDFFITDDDNTYHKAKAIYKHFNIETIVCKSHEFVAEFYGKAILSNTETKRISEIIPEIIANSFVLKSSLDENLNPVEIYQTGHYILSYFNRLQTTTNADNSIIIHLYKNSKNYSSFNFFKEIATVTNKIVAQFGTDWNLRFDYSKEIDNPELINHQWKGRFWKFDNTTIELNMQPSPFGLTLSLYLK